MSSSGGPTLRGRAGPWQLGIAADPSFAGTERLELRSELDHDSARSYRLPSDSDAAGGWIRLEAGRDLWRRGRLSLGLLATGSYHRATEERVSLEPAYGADPTWERTRSEETRQTIWGVGIGLRPSYALLERLTIDFDFGFSLLWWDRRGETWAVEHGYPEWEHKTTHEDGTSFQTVGGWGGLGSLNLILWF